MNNVEVLKEVEYVEIESEGIFSPEHALFSIEGIETVTKVTDENKLPMDSTNLYIAGNTITQKFELYEFLGITSVDEDDHFFTFRKVGYLCPTL